MKGKVWIRDVMYSPAKKKNYIHIYKIYSYVHICVYECVRVYMPSSYSCKCYKEKKHRSPKQLERRRQETVSSCPFLIGIDLLGIWERPASNQQT